jgi:hypothetical protein
MSTFDSDDLETMGYFLPKDSQLRLKKLREYVQLLSHLAQPREADVEQEWIPEIRVGEMAICLGLLAEQVGLVLDEISWPAYRSEGEAVPGAGAEPEAAEEVPGDAGGRYIFGMTLEQVDTLHRLISMISAHGDVVMASDDAEFADHTLSLLGDAIFNDARTVRAIIRQVESQRLKPARGSQTGVSEERAVYRAVRKTGSGTEVSPRILSLNQQLARRLREQCAHDAVIPHGLRSQRRPPHACHRSIAKVPGQITACHPCAAFSRADACSGSHDYGAPFDLDWPGPSVAGCTMRSFTVEGVRPAAR